MTVPLTTTDNTRPGGESETAAPCRHHGVSTDPCECDIAWRLADAVAEDLTGWDKTVVYAFLGAEDFRRAVILVFTCALRDEIAVPADFSIQMSAWLDRHPGVFEEPLIRCLLSRIHLRADGGARTGDGRP